MVTINLLWLLLIIPLALIALLAVIILTVGVKIKLIANNEDVIRLCFYVYGIKVFSFGVKDEKPPEHVKVSDYTLKKVERRRRREERKLRRRAARALKKAAEPEAEASDGFKTTPDIMYIIKYVLNVIKLFCRHYAGKLKIRLHRLNITVATEDPAATAVLYGVVIQGVGYLIEFLRNNTDFDLVRHAPLHVDTDFLSNETKFDVVITVNIRLRRVLSLIWRSGIHSPADLAKFTKVKKIKNKKEPESAT